MDLIEVNNVFAAVFEKKRLDSLLDIFGSNSPFLSSKPGFNIRFWGTRGTVDYIKSKGFSVQSVVSGFDYGGRVKSLHRANFVRILADRSNPKHLEALRREFSNNRYSVNEKSEDNRIDSGQARMTESAPFDLVVVDLYAPDPSIFPESMDIGGQSLVRAAIKNYQNVALAFDEESIEKLVLELKKNALMTSLAFRKQQAKAAAKFIAQRTKLEAEMFDKV
ncbi:MAG: Phosphoribosylaminoimidazolecarboxamide formyltransferase/IMP cyclohydrolase [Candidatus Azambacteria bacterium GW2011_GWA1_44_9]|uniref:Phosphoribosylaminoimidazolecarboxamide formyltransferase/IMP cyclohydrolase n=1 Tax=Candidatus Azambacteria bacterium GW2011_GWA1_44_9 TaxID=1618610 RepID=A0A0G1KAK0_9BACT|nr:MAG: Phosphoribosylaminoimidazolecarboxamide formyltransferase/IMP cyclohydrolase [Candidatus Azambacteria bacterium GW2011_GWA1_44_9]